MRNHLLASAALVGATVGVAQAQVPSNPSQGQLAAPYGAGPATNNNNNSWGIANTPSGSKEAGSLSTIYAPNTVKVPTPGTIVIRLNGRVEADVTATWTSLDSGFTATGAPNGFKLSPVGISSYMRLYPGFDGVAANGIRYGASIELRQNFGAGGTPANSPSANTSAQTVFVRRAFTYLASDSAGLLRLGQSDGVLGLFDNCIFTTQCWDAGISIVNGSGGPQVVAPSGATGIPWAWINQSGADYGNNKIVYLSPQYYGFDLGIQYAPNMGNTLQTTGNGVGCGQAGPTCINLSSGNDATRWLNQVGIGLRYQQTFGAVDFKTYGFYEAAGKENLTVGSYLAPGVPTRSAGSGAGGVTNIRFDNLSFYKAGVAVTAANITLAADYIGGAVNGSLAMRPTGGAPMNAVMTGLTYAAGPISAGAQVGVINSQGAAQLVNVSQRREYMVAFGGTYRLAPGLQLVAEYLYSHRYQGGFDFATNLPGTPGGPATAGTTTRSSQSQGALFSTVLSW